MAFERNIWQRLSPVRTVCETRPLVTAPQFPPNHPPTKLHINHSAIDPGSRSVGNFPTRNAFDFHLLVCFSANDSAHLAPSQIYAKHIRIKYFNYVDCLWFLYGILSKFFGNCEMRKPQIKLAKNSNKFSEKTQLAPVDCSQINTLLIRGVR